MKSSPELLAKAEACGAVLTGKPDGSEPITVVFTIPAWQAFDAVVAQPIDMILHCPSCHAQHVDATETCEDEGCDLYGTPHSHLGAWENPPHRSHLCAACGYTWRPADVCTNGVATIKTKGKSDT